MFEQYPKTRPALPGPLAEVYASYYKANREGETTATSLSQKMETWLHRKVAEDVAIERCVTTLEIGAGTLNQLDFEPARGAYDVVEPFIDLYKNSKNLHRVRNFYADIDEVPVDSRFDRITSIAAFEHICDLPLLVSQAVLRLKDEGVLRVSIPSEGRFLWTLGWKLTTGLEFKLKYGLDYGQLLKHEHVNTASEIEEVIRYFFGDVKCSAFGLSKSISFYQFFSCRAPNRAKAQEFIASRR